MATTETRQDDALTRKQALKAFLGITLFLALVGLWPATGAYQFESWVGYWSWGSVVALGVPALMIGLSYFKPKKTT